MSVTVQVRAKLDTTDLAVAEQIGYRIALLFEEADVRRLPDGTEVRPLERVDVRVFANDGSGPTARRPYGQRNNGTEPFTLDARRPGKCESCQQQIIPGERIWWDPRERRAYHDTTTCAAHLRSERTKRAIRAAAGR